MHNILDEMGEEFFKRRLLEILPEERPDYKDMDEGWNSCLAEIRKRTEL